MISWIFVEYIRYMIKKNILGIIEVIYLFIMDILKIVIKVFVINIKMVVGFIMVEIIKEFWER